MIFILKFWSDSKCIEQLAMLTIGSILKRGVFIAKETFTNFGPCPADNLCSAMTKYKKRG